ncbi:hypothetical protein V5O48_008371, partial [Marasmius crinis-equi]
NGILGIPEPGENYICAGGIVVSPASRGSVTLASANPLVYPSIDLNLYSSDFDLHAMREAVRSAVKLMSFDIWNGYLVRPAFDVNTDSDEELNAYILNSSVAANHPVGTSSMSPKGAKWGVVDPNLSVKGIAGVRVVDASVMSLALSLISAKMLCYLNASTLSPSTSLLSTPSTSSLLSSSAPSSPASDFPRVPSGSAVPLPGGRRVRACSFSERRGYQFSIAITTPNEFSQQPQSVAKAKGDLGPRAGGLPRRIRKKPRVQTPQTPPGSSP